MQWRNRCSRKSIGVVLLLRIRFPSRPRMRTWLPCSWKGCCQRPCPMIAQQRQFSRVHVRIAVIGLMRILSRVVRVHVVRHGAPVDHEIGGVVRLGRNFQAASGSASSAAHFPWPVTCASA